MEFGWHLLAKDCRSAVLEVHGHLQFFQGRPAKQQGGSPLDHGSHDDASLALDGDWDPGHLVRGFCLAVPKPEAVMLLLIGHLPAMQELLHLFEGVGTDQCASAPTVHDPVAGELTSVAASASSAQPTKKISSCMSGGPLVSTCSASRVSLGEGLEVELVEAAAGPATLERHFLG